MDRLTRSEFRDLMAKPGGQCVSLYLPTERSGPSEKNASRFKKLLREAKRRLLQSGLRSPEARTMLQPAEALLESGLFWRHMADGLAAFISSGNSRFYRLPHSFEELVAVNERFHLKPLFPVLAGDGRFLILALSQRKVMLLQGTRYSVEEIEVPGVPAGIEDALKDDNPEKHLQFHTETSVSQGGRRAAIFHGQGGVGSDDPKNRIWRYLHRVDDGLRLRARLAGAPGTPIVLVGVRYLLDIYREVSSYPSLLEEEIDGNPDLLSPEELHQKAWPLVEQRYQQPEVKAAELYREGAAKGRVTEDIGEIVLGGYVGKVEVLFAPVDRQVWGYFDLEAWKIQVHETEKPGDEDLVDLAAVETLTRGGTVHVVPAERLPGKGPACALLRY